jgi:hypothetical protein
MYYERKDLINDLIEEIKSRALKKFAYGGYNFYPDGKITKRQSERSDLVISNSRPLTPKYHNRTVEQVVDETSIDLFLICDAIKCLSTSQFIEGDGHRANSIIAEEQAEADGWENGKVVFAEREIAAKYIGRIDDASLKFSITDDFDSHARHLGAWCKERIDSKSPTALKKVFGRNFKRKAKVNV